MKRLAVMNNMSRTFYKTAFGLRKHSPEILTAVGVVGVVASAVLACKATRKIDAILEKAKEDVDKVHRVLEHPELVNEEYTVEDSKKDLAIAYVQTGVKLVKLYSPAIVLGTLSITSILASTNILRKRNLALAAAYATVDTGFKEYRHRVLERFGENVDKELRYNTKAEEIEETIIDEKGKEKVVKKTVNVSNIPHVNSDYARFFDEYCNGWTKDAEYNLIFLKQQQSYANDLLQKRGYVFLNEVYEMLGIDKTKAGQVVGWVYDESNIDSDNYIDFGIYDLYDPVKRDFVNGRERSILLDFNVTGNIWELMQ